MNTIRKISPLILIAVGSLPAQVFAHGTEDEHQKEVLWANVFFYGMLGISILLLIAFLVSRSKAARLKHVRAQEERVRRNQLTRLSNILKWATLLSLSALVVSGVVVFNANKTGEVSEPRLLDRISIDHAHGMSYSADGSKLFFAVHDGLRVYENGQWSLPAGEKHDYMGFSMVDDGFYSSGHPAPGSNKKNPFGIVKSTNEGESFEPLALYGEIDFHGMSVGYQSHAIYVFNPLPNQAMSELGLHYSTDEAKSWTKSKVEGLVGQPATLAVHPTDSGTMAVGTDQGIFVSTNYGDSFTRISSIGEGTSVFFNLKGTLYAAGIQLEPSLVAIDLARGSIQNLNIPPMTNDAIAFIGQHPARPNEMAIMTFQNDAYVTQDGAATWTSIIAKGRGTSKPQ
ncbi:F510_1955 family glycosylhydrolase [Paenibacillus turpanensis]|uniref:F510_1955 family glycosylhydrolase n=1 Tax=Paenibacillus turpanensis TaxID=2689078 RepID=UPI001409DAED|nr:hypothetical protein [Paenibacillus turpanensis]